jgi:acyl carrier protein
MAPGFVLDFSPLITHRTPKKEPPVSAFASLAEFKQFMIDSLQLEGLSAESIAEDQPLFQGGLGLDSIDALELVVALEQRGGWTIRADEIEQSAFATVGALFRFVQRLWAAGGS